MERTDIRVDDRGVHAGSTHRTSHRVPLRSAALGVGGLGGAVGRGGTTQVGSRRIHCLGSIQQPGGVVTLFLPQQGSVTGQQGPRNAAPGALLYASPRRIGVHRRETDCTQQKGPEDASLGALLVCRVPPTVMGLGYSPSVRKPLCVSGDQQVAGRSPGVVRSDSRHDPPERSMCLPLSPRCVTLPGDRDSVVCVLHFRQLWRYCGASHRSVRNEPPRLAATRRGGSRRYVIIAAVTRGA